jgi:hypothetical protein
VLVVLPTMAVNFCVAETVTDTLVGITEIVTACPGGSVVGVERTLAHPATIHVATSSVNSVEPCHKRTSLHEAIGWFPLRKLIVNSSREECVVQVTAAGEQYRAGSRDT